MRRLAALLLLSCAVATAQPVVTKVEPPNWWTPTSLNTVRVLITGTQLSGATVTSDLKTGNVATSAKGAYLFVDVLIPPGSRPGSHPLTIRTGQGSATAPFQLLKPLDRKSRFAGFAPSDVIYLIMPDRFSNGDPANDNPPASPGLFDPSQPHFYHGGDLRGIENHLGYLKELGVTAIWLNPWYDNVNHLNSREMPDGKPITDYHGYGAIDFYGVEEHFGDLASLQHLVEAAHAQGIKVIQDEVANHTGPYHPWAQDPPTPTWFHGSAAQHITETFQLWPLIDPKASPTLLAQTLDGWFADILPDLNQDDPECARYLIQNTLWWIGITGLDAIRMDTLPYVPKKFWEQWMAAIHREYPNVNVVGEVFDPDPALPSAFQKGNLSVFDFPDYFKVREVIAKGHGSLRDLAGMRAHDAMYQNPGLLGTFIGNHDVARFMSEPGATADRLKLAFTWLMTSRGVPTIYYGDEIGMQGGPDPDNRRDFPASAFERSGRTPEQESIWRHVQMLNRLRTSTPALQTGVTEDVCAAEQQWVFTRTLPGQKVWVEMNNAETPASIPCGGPMPRLQTAFGDGRYGETLAAHAARISIQTR